MIDELDLEEWLDLLRPEWMHDGACRETAQAQDVFFPKPNRMVGRVGYNASNDPSEPAKAICAGCPVRETCLEYALVNNIEHGVWGGESQRGRVRIRKQRRLAA